MSTRCQVIIKDQYDEIWFYRHCDGYPEGVMPSLEKFLSWVKEGKIRKNAEQSCGWLVIIGHNENKVPNEPIDNNDWEVGSFEPCSSQEHGDIEYLYTIDLVKEKITYIKK